ncbi:hypothetical protein D0C16_12275 [Cellvibrio sp. KY-GH-1]|nr:hypothetical protein D0C16_12275 [Cellvibrio sp. KY-GH-1]
MQLGAKTYNRVNAKKNRQSAVFLSHADKNQKKLTLATPNTTHYNAAHCDSAVSLGAYSSVG